MFGRRHRIVILILAALAAGIALGVGLSLYFGAPPARVAEGPEATVSIRENVRPPVSVTLPRVDPRADLGHQPLPGAANAPPPILEGSGPVEAPAVASLPPAPAVAPAPASPELALPAPEPAPASPEPAWRRHAARAVLVPGQPVVSVVIDDAGLDRPRSARAMRLPAPVTLAFLPYAPNVAEQAAAARAAGHELLVHVSMEPSGNGDSGPHTLRVDQPPEELRARLDWALSRFDGYVGINNHMGSRFTADLAGMDVVMAALRARGLLFLDSRTTKETVAFDRARARGVPAASRQVFLDGTRTREWVDQQLRELEARATKEGHAIAIGHPHDVTLDALEAWLPTLAAKGIQLAPVSALVESSAPTVRRAPPAPAVPAAYGGEPLP